MIAFGPIPSRRLGHSLGVNNIPPKNCSYACVYCQVGKAIKMDMHRNSFYEPELVLEKVREKISHAREKGESIDYLSLVPDGEPTLDLNLGEIINQMKSLGYPVAVITNGTLLWRHDVRRELAPVDWISVKLDAITEKVWKKIDRPYKSLELPVILEGIMTFRESFRGTFTTETMLVRGYNDSLEEMKALAAFVGKLRPDKAYLGVPTRPPAVKSVTPPDEEFLAAAFQVFHEQTPQVELLIGHEGDAFAFTGNIMDDILSITAVHPMRQEAMSQLLEKAGAPWSLVEGLIEQGQLIRTQYQGTDFYLRKLDGSPTGA